MKKISLSFFLVLLSLFLGSFSCEDHVVPEPQVQTLPLTALPQPSRVSTPVGYPHKFYLKFPALGNSVVDEYGTVYSVDTDNEQMPVNVAPTIGGANCLVKMFGPPPVPVVSVEYNAIDYLPFFFTVYYRAYAKINGGGIIYGETLKYDWPSQ